MFQPQPTPYSTYGPYGIHIANAEVPEYAFQPTPLGQFGTGNAGAGAGTGSSGVGAGAGAGAGAGGPTAADIFASPIFHNHNPNPLIPTNANHLPYNSVPHNHHQSHSRRIKMEPQHPNDLAQQEAAAREYKPQLQGPLIGDRRPSTEITEEYAKADPIYVTKTLALPQTYSHYRPVQGDGNCGWRAIAFSYFEILAGCGDINQAQGELSRLTALNGYIENVGGHQAWILEDMVSETFDLLNMIIGAMSNGQDAMPFVMDKFNNAESSQSIVYHMRLLASSWLRGNADQYQPYMDTTVANYIDNTITPVDREIDHLSVMLLFEILLKPAGMVLEIAYLDRSEGHEVNAHRMPEEANGQDVLNPIIYLLYRPGHYDILYRDSVIQPPPMPPAPTSLQVNRVSFTQQPEIENTISPLQNFSVDMSALAMIPGFAAPELSPLGSPPAAPSPMSDPYAPSPQSPWMAQPFSDGLAAAPPPAPQPSPPQQQPPTPMTEHPLRFSKYNFPDLVETSAFHEPAFTTNTFKNSHFNVAHYNNMNFQPEMYRPDADDEMPHAKERGGRKRSSEHCAVIKKENRG
ncbi:cysteine proteinase [Hypoxylon rubiginosum]|uniref:Cysteine proteinase n=1 Tax=Hypoxylon rubiginosum TaxID=110542 RepID=A0ACC0CXP7_9PEZI|nr:cysteine proteinase [Hypoxylon rubiginosum]